MKKKKALYTVNFNSLSFPARLTLFFIFDFTWFEVIAPLDSPAFLCQRSPLLSLSSFLPSRSWSGASLLTNGGSGLSLPMATRPSNQETLPQLPSAMAKAKHSENRFPSKQFPRVRFGTTVVVPSFVAGSGPTKGKSAILSSVIVSMGPGTSSVKNQAPKDLCPNRHSHSRGKSKPPQIRTSAFEDATHPPNAPRLP